MPVPKKHRSHSIPRSQPGLPAPTSETGGATRLQAPDIASPRLRALLAATLALGMLGAAGIGSRPTSAQTRAEFVPTFSTNTRVKQQLERLDRLAAQKMWDEWLAGYQQLVDDPRDLVIERDGEFLDGVRFRAHQMLAAQPAAVRQKYRTLFDPTARKLYDEAVTKNDGAAMRDVYSRYRFSTYGPRALLWIANRSLDEGRPELARVAYSRLSREPGVTVQTLLRYALAADAAGKPAEATAVLDRIRKEFAAQPTRLAGKDLTGGAAADAVAKALRKPGAGASSVWPSFAGAGGDRRMAGQVTGAQKKLWEFAQSTKPEGNSGNYRGRVLGFSSLGSGRFQFLSFPVVGGDRVWIQGPQNLTAVNLDTGEPAWDQQDFSISRDESGLQNTDPRLGGIYYRSGRAVQTAPTLDGHVLLGRFPLSSSDRDTNRWPSDFSIGAFDARSGTPLWQRVAGGEPRGSFYNLPTLSANMVLGGVTTFKGGITEYNAVALDAATGEELWSTYLGAGSDPLGIVDGSPAAVKDGVVWIESSLYTLNMLDLITGELRQIYRYDPGKRTTFRGGFDSSPMVPHEPVSLIAAAQGPVVFCPRWGTDVVALDSATGRLLWSSPKAPGQSSMGSLFAVDDKLAYVCGDHLQALNLEDGAREWHWEPEQASSRHMGFAALAGDRIYFPVEGKIHVRAAADGRALETLDLVDALTDQPYFTSLVVHGNKLIVSTKDKVVAFGPK